MISQLLRGGRNTRVCNGNRIQWLQSVSQTDTLSIFLNHSKELTPVRAIGWFIDSRVYLLLDDFTEFLQLSSWNRNTSFHPRFMLNHWYLYWWKEIMSETPSFLIRPCKAIFLEHHKMVQKLSLFCPQEITRMQFVNDL